MGRHFAMILIGLWRIPLVRSQLKEGLLYGEWWAVIRRL